MKYTCSDIACKQNQFIISLPVILKLVSNLVLHGSSNNATEVYTAVTCKERNCKNPVTLNQKAALFNSFRISTALFVSYMQNIYIDLYIT